MGISIPDLSEIQRQSSDTAITLLVEDFIESKPPAGPRRLPQEFSYYRMMP
jgi:hypothetical protein